MSTRKSTATLLKTGVHCAKVYPVIGSPKASAGLASVGAQLTKAQAQTLAIHLLAAAEQDWAVIDLTFYRQIGRHNQVCHVTVTEGALSNPPTEMLLTDPSSVSVE